VSRAAPAPGRTDEEPHNRVLEFLVEEDDPENIDVVGLLAYGLYKIRKRDWIVQFCKASGGRRPNNAETAAVTQNYLTISMRQTLRGQASDMLTALCGHLFASLEPANPRSHSRL
jgi:hypothetical protein